MALSLGIYSSYPFGRFSNPTLLDTEERTLALAFIIEPKSGVVLAGKSLK
jgi:hypothetical protein